MQPKLQEVKKLAKPAAWASAQIGELDITLPNSTHVYIPTQEIHVATRYPIFEDGNLIANVTQAQAAQFLRDHNKANKTNYRIPFLFEDEVLRDQLGKDHAVFDENFERNGQPWRWGYVADFTRPNSALKPVNGVDDQQLVQRVLYWRMPEGEVEVGPITIAPSGMVPRLTRKEFETNYKAVGMKKLEQLRGREISEQGEEIVDIRNALGYPQFTLDHNAKNRGEFIDHSNHVYTPLQNAGEAVGVRNADWDNHGGLRSFYANLDIGAGDSNPHRSFPIVRGSGVKADVQRTFVL